MGWLQGQSCSFQSVKWGLSCDEGEKQINYVKSEYIGRTLVTFCGILIVLITLAIIAFICGKESNLLRKVVSHLLRC